MAGVTLAGCGSDGAPASPAAGTGAPAPASIARTTLAEVALPDLSGIDASLRERLTAQHASLRLARDGASRPDGELAAAYGSMGKLLLAAELLMSAEAAFGNAQRLAPTDFRWPYYLAHAYRRANDPAKAVVQFERASTLRPSDVPALAWLGRLHVDLGDADRGVPLLERVLALEPNSAVARFGLGRAALGRRQFAEAASQLEAALAADPVALGIHYQLAAAYRGLGDSDRAATHLKRWKDVDLSIRDPLMDEAGRLLQTALDFTVRGTRALDAKNWTEAASLFQQGLVLAPTDPILHLNLGTARYLAGDEPAAFTQFHEAVRLSPGYARGHFSLGVLHEARGQDADAIARFEEAVRHDPGLTDARFALADALRRADRAEVSLPHYEALVRADPSASQARFGHALALVRLGRWREARAVLDDAVKAHPDQVGFTHALARVLAAAPDETVRDGTRALAIAKDLSETYASVALAETLAMAEAEVGQFASAVRRQKAAIAAATQAGQLDVARRLAAALVLYERKAPNRTPWAEDDPVFYPRSAAGIGRR